MEVNISLTPQQYTVSQSQNFIIKFYWFEKNRTFEIPKKDFQQAPNDKYQYTFKLPSIVKGKYRFHASGSITSYNLKLVYNNDTIFESTAHVNNHTFEIIEQNSSALDNEPTSTYSTIYINTQQFMKDEQQHRTRITMKSIKRWNYYWYNLHYFSKNYYPDKPTIQDKQQVRDLIHIMSTTGIPCPRCKAHFNLYLQKNRIEDSLISSYALSLFFYNLHNDVNRRNGKRIFSIQESHNKYIKSTTFENDLSKKCKPLFQCFIDNECHKFPLYLNNNSNFENF